MSFFVTNQKINKLNKKSLEESRLLILKEV